MGPSVYFIYIFVFIWLGYLVTLIMKCQHQGIYKQGCNNVPSCRYIVQCIHSPSTETLNFLRERKELISLIRLFGNFNLDSFFCKPRCHALSNSFSIFKNTAAVDMLLLKFEVTWSVSLIPWSVVLWPSTETELAYIKQASFLSVPFDAFDYFQNNFIE
jgi:hypothetical protein